MSPQHTLRPAAGAPFAGEIIDTPMVEEVSESFLAYSLSVITSRAIPDVRDGLKPVQRRILYSMLRMGLRPDSPHRKCARVVGDTMGNYHPHGDAAIYDALVRMGQDFSRAVPLVDPQGNFGTLDDPPAAARYTECRLAAAAIEMLDELDEDTVDFRASYDGEASEPVCLPGRLPNLLVNGTSGIAVGMATNMAPHNLREVYEAVRLQMADPEIPTEDLLAVLGGPDFPSGGVVLDDGMAEIYARGRGTIRVRARAEIIEVGPRRQAIRILELPWLVGPEKVVGRIKEVVSSGRLDGVEDIKNLSDRHIGLCIQVDCRPGTDAAAVLAKLWRLAPLEETFRRQQRGAGRRGAGDVLAEGPAGALHRPSTRRGGAAHALPGGGRRGAAARPRGSDGRPGQHRAGGGHHPRQRHRRGGAGGAVCGVVPQRTAGRGGAGHAAATPSAALERDRIIAEGDRLVADLAEYRELLGSEAKRRELVLAELGELAERYGRPRRSRIIRAAEAGRRHRGHRSLARIGRLGFRRRRRGVAGDAVEHRAGGPIIRERLAAPHPGPPRPGARLGAGGRRGRRVGVDQRRARRAPHRRRRARGGGPQPRRPRRRGVRPDRRRADPRPRAGAGAWRCRRSGRRRRLGRHRAGDPQRRRQASGRRGAGRRRLGPRRPGRPGSQRRRRGGVGLRLPAGRRHRADIHRRLAAAHLLGRAAAPARRCRRHQRDEAPAGRLGAGGGGTVRRGLRHRGDHLGGRQGHAGRRLRCRGAGWHGVAHLLAARRRDAAGRLRGAARGRLRAHRREARRPRRRAGSVPAAADAAGAGRPRGAPSRSWRPVRGGGENGGAPGHSDLVRPCRGRRRAGRGGARERRGGTRRQRDGGDEETPRRGALAVRPGPGGGLPAGRRALRGRLHPDPGGPGGGPQAAPACTSGAPAATGSCTWCGN